MDETTNRQTSSLRSSLWEDFSCLHFWPHYKEKMNRNYAFIVIVCTIAAIGLIAASMGTSEWTRNTFHSVNGTSGDCTGTRVLGLFRGTDSFSASCFLSAPDQYNTLSPDSKFDTTMLYVTIVFCAVALLFLFITLSIASYNMCARPYETYAGPIGLLVYLAIAATFEIVAMISYLVFGFTAVNDSMPQPDAYTFDNSNFGYSFYTFVASIVPTILGAVASYMSEKKKFGTQIKNKLKSKSQREHDITQGQKNDIFMM